MNIFAVHKLQYFSRLTLFNKYFVQRYNKSPYSDWILYNKNVKILQKLLFFPVYGFIIIQKSSRGRTTNESI